MYSLFQDPNPNNLVASTMFYSESTRAMLCLVRFICLLPGLETLIGGFDATAFIIRAQLKLQCSVY